MIINKITLGWVWQSFDTDTKQYTEQCFVAGDDVAYEENDGNICPSIEEAIGDTEPYLPFEMVQPGKNIRQCLSTLLKMHRDGDVTSDVLAEEFEEIRRVEK